MGRITKARTPILGVYVATAIRVCRKELVWLLILSGNQQLCSGGDESSGSSYGGCYKESPRVPPGRNRQEPSSYGNTGGVYGSGCNNKESSSYNQSSGRHSDNLQQSSYGSESNRHETSSYGGSGTSHSSRHQTRGPAPMAPQGITMIVMAPSAETMDPIL